MDVAVAGFDDERAALLVSPQLTTVRQPYGEMGRAAVDPPPVDQRRWARDEFATELIARASTTG